MGARCAPHPGKAAVQVATIHVLIDDLANHGPPEAILLLVGVVVDAFEVVKVILDQGIQGRIAGISGMINTCVTGP